MMVARKCLLAVLAAGVLAYPAGRAAAGHSGQALPGVAPPGLVFAVTSVDEMNQEMRTAYIRGIQEELAAHHYDPGPADGVLGPMTRKAIRHYQRDAGLPQDGVASKELLDHLKFAEPRVFAKPAPPPDPLVLDVQTRLRDRGYYRGALDGLMGSATREAIRSYSYDAGLPISGAIDGPLLERLRRAPPPTAGGEPRPAAAPAAAPTDEKAATEPARQPELQTKTPPPAE